MPGASRMRLVCCCEYAEQILNRLQTCKELEAVGENGKVASLLYQVQQDVDKLKDHAEQAWKQYAR